MNYRNTSYFVFITLLLYCFTGGALPGAGLKPKTALITPYQIPVLSCAVVYCGYTRRSGTGLSKTSCLNFLI